MERKDLWEILVPHSLEKFCFGITEDRENKYGYYKVRMSHHKLWDSRAMKYSEGCTILRSGKGTWKDDLGDYITERMIPVRLLITRSDIFELAEFTKEHYKQDAVMFYRVSEEVHII